VVELSNLLADIWEGKRFNSWIATMAAGVIIGFFFQWGWLIVVVAFFGWLRDIGKKKAEQLRKKRL
jgi:hypothetical protein